MNSIRTYHQHIVVIVLFLIRVYQGCTKFAFCKLIFKVKILRHALAIILQKRTLTVESMICKVNIDIMSQSPTKVYWTWMSNFIRRIRTIRAVCKTQQSSPYSRPDYKIKITSSISFNVSNYKAWICDYAETSISTHLSNKNGAVWGFLWF